MCNPSFLVLLAGLTAAASGMLFPWSPNHQQPLALFPNPRQAGTPRFSVGFSLQSSYGAAAVIFEGAGGELETHTRIRYGCEGYRRVMARLSLESSQHLAPPYKDNGEFAADQPRMAVRVALKAVGLPASYEVAVLAQVIRHLRSELESDYGISISEAVFTSSHLLALYQDDLQDVAQNVGVKYVTPKSQYLPILWESAAAYAGYGLGICEHWQDEDRCREEEEEMPHNTVLAVHYSRNALTVSLAKISTAVATFEPDYRHVENFTLGFDAISGYPNPEDYWADVKRTLLHTMVEFPGFPKPAKIMITGDMANGSFREFLEKTIKGHMGVLPPVLSDSSDVVAARGAAEFMRRGPAWWS